MNSIGLFGIIFIAFSLSADCFAVALSGSIARRIATPLQVLRISLSFGVSQTLMCLLGWLAGQTVVELIAGFDHWVAFALLAFVGGRMAWDSSRRLQPESSARGLVLKESFHPEEEEEHSGDITRGVLLLTLSVATSLDSLAVGLSFAFVNVSIALGSSIIGVVAFLVTAAGALMGRRLGGIFGKRAELVGGLVLIGIGIKIILEHMM